MVITIVTKLYNSCCLFIDIVVTLLVSSFSVLCRAYVYITIDMLFYDFKILRWNNILCNSSCLCLQIWRVFAWRPFAFSPLFVVSLHGGAKGRHAETRQMVILASFRMATFQAAKRRRMKSVVLSCGGAKGRHAKTRKSHHLAGFRVAPFRLFAPKTRYYDMTQISHHSCHFCWHAAAFYIWLKKISGIVKFTYLLHSCVHYLACFGSRFPPTSQTTCTYGMAMAQSQAPSTGCSTSTFRAWLNPRLHQKSVQPQLLEHGSIPGSIHSLLNLNF